MENELSQKIELSTSIAELSKALSAAQGEVGKASKDKTNPHFRSKYADLEAVWDACREPLSKNNLAVMQLPTTTGADVSVTTIMSHCSGEWVKFTLTIKASKLDAHGIGSAITYGRRFSLQSLVGIAPEDDDGNAAAVSQPDTRSAAALVQYPYNGSDKQKQFLNSICEKLKVPKELRGKIHTDFIAAKVISNGPELTKAIEKFMTGVWGD
jgi:hypothetical protein